MGNTFIDVLCIVGGFSFGCLLGRGLCAAAEICWERLRR